MKLEEKTLLLGIDPSFVNFGVCIYNPSTKDMNLKTGNMTAMVKWIQSQCKIRNCIAIVENPALDKTTFNMWGLLQKAINGHKNYENNRHSKIVKRVTMEDVQSTFAISMNYAQKVGENKAAAKQIIAMLSEANVPIIQVAPSKRQKAFTKSKGKIVRKNVLTLKMPTKTTQEQFKTLIGYNKRSNEHNRDAATLVFGRTIKWAAMTVQSEQRKGSISKSLPSPKNGNFFILNSKEKTPKPF